MDRFKNNDPRRMWTGIHALIDYKPANSIPPNSNGTLPEELNNFYARFDRGNTEPPIKTVLTPDNLPLTLSTSDICATMGKVNSHKAAGPYSIPGRVLKACAEQLAEIFNIFNLSLVQSIVPNCFKTATIVLVPKNAGAVALNDLCPVALTPIIELSFLRGWFFPT